jgi:hypothetical protein
MRYKIFFNYENEEMQKSIQYMFLTKDEAKQYCREDNRNSMEKIVFSDYFHCRDCGEFTLRFRRDPWFYELEGISTKAFLCNACYRQRCDDI